MANPILQSLTFRRDLPEARALEGLLADVFDERNDARRLAQEAGLDASNIDVSGPPSRFWGNILDNAAATGRLPHLIERISAQAINQVLRDAIVVVRNVVPNGSLQDARLLLDGNRPFLGRKNLRSLLPELQDWATAAAVLVVRGVSDSGRTETQTLLADRNKDQIVLLDENLPLSSSMRLIWKRSGAQGPPPVPGAEQLTTESALLTDFWTDVQDALETTDRRLWVLFDDLDKGPGRVEVRTLAEVLAMRLGAIPFQRRLRLVLLGYPELQLPQKVPPTVVRNDETEVLDTSHVRAFLDYCLTAAGKKFDPDALPGWAEALYQRASASASTTVPLYQALNAELQAWHKKEMP